MIGPISTDIAIQGRTFHHSVRKAENTDDLYMHTNVPLLL